MEITANEIEVNGVKYVPKGSESPAYEIKESEFAPWETGESYHIETVTKYFTGRLIGITKDDFILVQACWIASTGDFSAYVNGAGAAEAEPYPEDAVVTVSRGAYVSGVKRELILELTR